MIREAVGRETATVSLLLSLRIPRSELMTNDNTTISAWSSCTTTLLAVPNVTCVRSEMDDNSDLYFGGRLPISWFCL